jgi:tRNA(Arg) A34 adenosine deaminase TadA
MRCPWKELAHKVPRSHAAPIPIRWGLAGGRRPYFGAAIFERETGRLLASGVNLVTSLDCSLFHPEIVAIMVAERTTGDFDLGGPGHPPYELLAGTQPCAMCLGAIPWSGVRHLVCGVRDENAEEIGFDEGIKPPDWVRSKSAASPSNVMCSAVRPPRCSDSTPKKRRDLQQPPGRVTPSKAGTPSESWSGCGSRLW